MDFPFDTEDGPSSPSTGAEESLVASVLIVDDEQVVLEVLKRLLSHEVDLLVVTAETAEGALELLTARRFDLLITDKNLPGMGGVELIAEARKLRPAIEAIMITGYASAESVLAALAAGATDYLRKPFDDIKVVRAKIRAALDRRRARVTGREAAKRIAREASALLAQGKMVPELVWQTLERALAVYELANREEGRGVVRVVGAAEAVTALRQRQLDASLAEVYDPALEAADVVVIDTARHEWRSLAERLAQKPPDVLLLARADADLADLLEALSLHMALVGFGASREDAQGAMVEKVRALLMRRNIEHSQAALSRALDAFREALKEA